MSDEKIIWLIIQMIAIMFVVSYMFRLIDHQVGEWFDKRKVKSLARQLLELQTLMRVSKIKGLPEFPKSDPKCACIGCQALRIVEANT